MPPVHSPLFILGSARSGTTLLRRLLNEHPDLALPRETHFISKTLRWARKGIRDGRITDWDRFRRAIAANAFMDELAPFIDETPLEDPRPLVRDVFDRAMTGYARSLGKTRWGEKTPPHLWFWAWIDELFPDARYLVISRDGRDVACSLALKDWAASDLLVNAARWKSEARKVTRLLSQVGPRAHRIWYEDLVRDPEAVLRGVCAFMDLPYDARMLARHSEAHGPVHDGSVGRHRRVLDKRTIRRMDALIGAELRAEGRYEIRSKPLGIVTRVWVHLRARAGLLRELAGKRAWRADAPRSPEDVRRPEAE